MPVRRPELKAQMVHSMGSALLGPDFVCICVGVSNPRQLWTVTDTAPVGRRNIDIMVSRRRNECVKL